jgi:hypothetical protein
MAAVAAGAGIAATLGACATQSIEGPPAAAPPAWFEAAAAEAGAQGFPELTDVPMEPRVTPADDPRWETIESELVAEREALQGSERATPAPANAEAEAESFRDGAVRAIEDTRRRY